MIITCFSCKVANDVGEKVGFRDECTQCHADLHACKCCAFYDPKVYNECRETSAEVIREKEKANYCEYFQPSSEVGGEAKKRDALFAAAEALFKKGGQ